MRAVVQRVSSGRVVVADEVVGQIGRGLLVYLGVGDADDEATAVWMADKVIGLRIFADEHDRMSRDVRDVDGGVLVVSQFTLYGDVRRGRRPSFDRACTPDAARCLYEGFCARVRTQGLRVATGRFQATMEVDVQVDGPVTILVDSDKEF